MAELNVYTGRVPTLVAWLGPAAPNSTGDGWPCGCATYLTTAAGTVAFAPCGTDHQQIAKLARWPVTLNEN